MHNSNGGCEAVKSTIMEFFSCGPPVFNTASTVFQSPRIHPITHTCSFAIETPATKQHKKHSHDDHINKTP